MMNTRLSGKSDISTIIQLLQQNDLPFSDISEREVTFIVAQIDHQIVGCIGVEKLGSDGLLRSFAVDLSFRNKGVGLALHTELLGYASGNGINTLHLLTTTASQYFLKLGFIIRKRESAPIIIQATSEFKDLCPASSTYMILDDISKHFKNA